MAAPFRRLWGRRKPPAETIWALREVSFDVQQGEVVGLIGHNGAGKSTLLKVLSRIVIPTTGRTEVYGKIGSLLEVGTGFHPDLTGRENIFLNGAVLGIGRAEIRRRFDEIVDFSGIEKFINTPVKWYSSGMYLRLAFSVAAHLDTEVLIMDEVLAVGDVSFQQKCMDKMHDIRKHGRTILFVSHSMAAVTRLCKRVILLDKGQVVDDGPAARVVNDYLGSSWKVGAEREWPELAEAPGNEVVRLRRVRVTNKDGETTDSFDIRHPVGIEVSYVVLQPGYVLTPKLDLVSDAGVHLFTTYDVTSEWRSRPRDADQYQSTLWIPGNFLSEGNVLVHASLVCFNPAISVHAHNTNTVTFQVVDNFHKDSARGDAVGPIPGAVRPLLDWTTQSGRERQTDQPPVAESAV
jgi:lipopolysaccharide transport system ATP-binding protein